MATWKTITHQVPHLERYNRKEGQAKRLKQQKHHFFHPQFQLYATIMDESDSNEVVTEVKDIASGEVMTLHYQQEPEDVEKHETVKDDTMESFQSPNSESIYSIRHTTFEIQLTSPLLQFLEDIRYIKGVDNPSYRPQDVCMCPHDAAHKLQPIPLPKFARDQLDLISLQAKLGYVLLGIIGEKRLAMFGYPKSSVIQILKRILNLAKCEVSLHVLMGKK